LTLTVPEKFATIRDKILAVGIDSEKTLTGLIDQVFDKALGELKKMKGAFGVAVRNSETLEAGGNRIDVAGSKAEVEANALALALINRLALRKGNVVNELLTRSAERIAAGERAADVLRDFIAEIRKLDLDEVARSSGREAVARAGDDADGSGGVSGAGGRAVDDPGEIDDAPGFFDRDVTPAQIDAVEAARPRSDHSNLPPEPDPRFAEPDSDGIRAATESMWHDIRVPDPELKSSETFDLADGKPPRSVADIRAEIDADKAAIEAMRNCLK
jgi:hypothetical protein